MLEDTIAAISTPLGEAGLAVVRLSGPKAIQMANAWFEPIGRESRKPIEAPSHTLHYGKIQRDGHVIDEVMLAILRAPRTFTREDMVEIDPNHHVSPIGSLPLPVSGLKSREADIPAGLAISPDARRLYVALNLSNRLLEMELPSGKPLRLVEVGFAPYEVVLAKTNIYVSNWGGRIPDANASTGPAGKGTLVRVDPVRFIASEGSVSVIA